MHKIPNNALHFSTERLSSIVLADSKSLNQERQAHGFFILPPMMLGPDDYSSCPTIPSSHPIPSRQMGLGVYAEGIYGFVGERLCFRSMRNDVMGNLPE
jgi:hypothetical protein